MKAIEEQQREARVDLAAAYRLAARLGFGEGICNHFTLMLPGTNDRFLLIPYGMHWTEVKASSLIVVDLGGNVVEGDGEAEDTAFFIHARIHEKSPSAACILHTHQPNITALCAIEGGRLEPCHQGALKFLDRVAYDDEFAGLALDTSEGDRLAACLGEKAILFMANHGVIVTGNTVADCFNDLYYLDRTCELQLKAMATGKPLKHIGDNVARHTHAQMMAGLGTQARNHFAALKRMLDREEPDYAD
jgi:ribulose-5-phosphate 4-epimerase/fuculose-1-phosphate aldolase